MPVHLNTFLLICILLLFKYTNALICKCDACSPHENNGTCEIESPPGVCFVSYEKASGVKSYGCLMRSQIEGLRFACDDPKAPFLQTKTECCDKHMCNDPVISLEPRPFPDNIQQYLVGVWTNFYWLEGILFLITILLIIIFMTLVFLKIRLKKVKSADYSKKDVEFSLASSDHLLLESGQSSRNPIDSSSGSGSGQPILVKRSIARQIQLEENIGRGSYGQVKRACLLGDSVAVKIFLSRDQPSWKREVEIYQTGLLRHDNILGFIAADNYDSGISNELWLITNYHEKGSLYDYLSQNVISVPELIKMTYSIVNGLAHLHMDIVGNLQDKPAIAHRDLKSKNILVKNNGECVIADLGLAVRLIDDRVDMPVDHRVGTKRYLSPEVLSSTIDVNLFDSFTRADIYSFALVVWELASRTIFATGIVCDDYKLPYEGMVESDPSIEEMRDVVVLKKLRPPQSPLWETDEKMRVFDKLMTECWYEDPAARLTAFRVKKTIASLDRNIESS